MPAASFRLVVATTVFASLLARSAGATSPPLEQLGLRDALLAKPEVIAALLPPAHQQLAQRFEAARRSPGSAQELLVATELSAVEVIRTVDGGRLARGRDALIAGQVRLTPLGIEVPFFTDPAADAPTALPPLEGVPAGATAEDEASALRGIAGAVLQGLLQQSQATRLVRVVSWPVAAVAIQDAVYVNAAWLLAMGPQSTSSITPSPKAAGSATESGCGGAVSDGTQGSLPSSSTPAYVSESGSAEEVRPKTTASPSPSVDTPPPPSTADSRRQSDAPNYLWKGGAGSGSAASAQSHPTADALPISSLTYALDSAATSPTDCCRCKDGGCDTSQGCQSGSSSCNNGSGSDCDNNINKGCTDSISKSTSCSSSSSNCNSSSSNCSSSDSCKTSSCSSGSCGSSSGGGSCGKCTLTPQPPRSNTPDPVTLAFLLAPLAFLLIQERRLRR